jgi:hypothetical protein
MTILASSKIGDKLFLFFIKRCRCLCLYLDVGAGATGTQEYLL